VGSGESPEFSEELDMNDTDKIFDQPNDRSLLRDLLPDARRLAETMMTQRPTPVGADLMAFLTAPA
jgi:hypothetical protein